MEDECKIEYLEEDEEVVQQCVKTEPIIVKTESIQPDESASNLENLKSLFDQVIEDQVENLLVERSKTQPKPASKRRKDDDDSDYDPSEDFEELETVRKRKRKSTKKSPTKTPQPVKNGVKTPAQSLNQPQSSFNNRGLVKTYENKLKSLPNLTIKPSAKSKNQQTTINKEDLGKSYVNKLKNLPNLTVQPAKTTTKSVKTFENKLKSLPNLTVQKKKVAKTKQNFMGFEEVLLPEPEPSRVSNISVNRIQGDNLISKLQAMKGLICKPKSKR